MRFISILVAATVAVAAIPSHAEDSVLTGVSDSITGTTDKLANLFKSNKKETEGSRIYLKVKPLTERIQHASLRFADCMHATGPAWFDNPACVEYHQVAAKNLAELSDILRANSPFDAKKKAEEVAPKSAAAE